MRPRALSLVLLAALALCLVGYFTLLRTDGRPTPSPEEIWPGTGPWAQQTLAELTLQEKVAQLFSVRAYGRFTSDDDPEYRRLIDLVERFGVGGVIFFQGDPFTQALLANDLQARAPLPLLVSQDMEWGAGMRIDRTTTFPRTMALGAAREPELTYAASYVTAREARALGTHQVYAPVADVNNNPQNPVINVRSFSEDPALVAEMVRAAVRGYQDGGAIATAKHFPGHGDTATDSHADLPILPFSKDRLDTLELVPFRAAIDEGVMSIMTGHVSLPEMEPDSLVPATLSPIISTQLLREELRFQGLIVTDGLDMRGVTKHFGAGEAAVRALEAGADMLLLSTDEYAARTAILRAVEEGRLSEAAIDEKVMRILRAKEWAGLPDGAQIDLNAARAAVGTRPHEMLAQTIGRRSLTLLRNENDILPLLDRTLSILSVALDDADDARAGSFFASRLRENARPGQRITTRTLDRRADPEDYQAVIDEAPGYDVVLVPTYILVRSWSGRIGLAEEHQAFLNRLVRSGTPVVLIAFGNPYMALGLDQPAAYLAAYSASEASQVATAQALFGRAPISGRLPITVPGLYAFGAGLETEQLLPRTGFPEEVGLDGDRLLRIDSLLEASIRSRSFPGAAVAVGRPGVIAKLGGYGYFTYDSERAITPHTLFDLASLTKVVATTTAAMKLYEAGRLALDTRVVEYLPAFAGGADARKREITIRHLLTHTAGLTPFRPFHQEGLRTRQAVLDAIFSAPLAYAPGTDSRYSDWGMITLALVVEAITGEPFGDYLQREVFGPLGMDQTGFRSVGRGSDSEVVPTEVDRAFRGRLVQGEVHDETAYLLGGTAGHAGLFSTVDDLARFADMLVNKGRVGRTPFLQPETIQLFTTPVDPEVHTRALGWDTKSPEGYSSAGQRFGPASFGHTGFTGTSLWIDPEAELYVVLLTNRVYPTRDNKGHVVVRPLVADYAFDAIVGPPEPLLPGPATDAIGLSGSR